MHSMLYKRNDQEFIRRKGALQSKLLYQQVPLPTQASSSQRKKINVLLVPKLNLINGPAQNCNQQALTLNYFWQQSEEVDLNANIVKYNLLYKGLSHPQSYNSKLDRDQFQKFRQKSCHFYSIQLNNKQNSNKFQSFYENSSYKQKFSSENIEKNNLSNRWSNRSRSSSFKKINRDTNIDVWHAKGLKFGSNALKFGIRNKHIVMVINQSNFQIEIPSETGTKEKSKRKQQAQFSRTFQEKWIKFIRGANKKCIIAIINLKKGAEEFSILQMESYPKVYQIHMTVSDINDSDKSKRLVNVVDVLLDDYMNNRAFRNADKSYSTFIKFPNKKPDEQRSISNHSTPIGTPRNKDYIRNHQQTSSYNVPKTKNIDSPDIPTNLKMQSGMVTTRRDRTGTPKKNGEETNKKTQEDSTQHKRMLSPFFLNNETETKKKKRKIQIISKTLKIEEYTENCDIFLPFCCLKKTVVQSTMMESQRPERQRIRPRIREENRITRDLFRDQI